MDLSPMGSASTQHPSGCSQSHRLCTQCALTGVTRKLRSPWPAGTRGGCATPWTVDLLLGWLSPGVQGWGPCDWAVGRGFHI